MDVLISGNDGVLVSRPSNTIPNRVISDWYECLVCGRIAEVPGSNDLLTNCPDCDGALIPVARSRSRLLSSLLLLALGPDRRPMRVRSQSEDSLGEAAPIARLVQRAQQQIPGRRNSLPRLVWVPLGKRGRMRPHGSTIREDFFKTFRARRAVRAEQIFREFYIDDKTDTQIAGALGWKKDSVKKERGDLVRRGNRFFGVCNAQTPP